MSYVNLNNPANFQLQEFEQLGFRYIVSGRPTIGGETYRTIFVLTDAVVTATCPNGDSLSSETLVAGTVIHGFFEDVSVASGSLLAYKAGPITAQEIFDAYKAYVYAQGGIVEGESCAVADIAALLEDKLYSAASLVLIPSGYKVSHLYAERPLDSNGDFTFTRASSATRVNSSGLVEKVRTNLVTYSNDFSNAAWQVIATPTLTANYDTNPLTGENDAWRFVAAGTGDRLYQPISGSNSAFSLYVKGTGQIRIRDNSAIYSFNATLTSSWQRIVVSIPAAFTNVQITGGPGGCDATIYAAQLETGDIATDYIATTTAAVSVGPVANLPRLDYSGGASCPRLLLEPQRTNLLQYSEQLNNSYWFKGGSGAASAPVVTANYAISPDGYQNADRVYFDAVGTSSADRSSLIRDFAFTTGQTYTISGYAKSATGANQILQFRIAGAQVGGELTATSEWQRFSVTHTATTSTTDNFGIQLRGNNTETTSDLLLYGLQLELASYATSYIPTLGASVTRLADACSKQNIAGTLPTAYPFTLFGEFEVTPAIEGQALTFSNTASNTEYFSIDNNSGFYRAISRPSTTISLVQSTTPETLGTHKICAVFTSTTIKLFVDGVLESSGANAQAFNASINDILIGQLRIISDTGNRNPVKQALVFKSALSDAQAIELTTL
jgi:hypothetical protein